MFEEKKANKAQDKNRIHNLVLESREKLSVSGVIDIDSFDEAEVLLYTDMGQVTVKGEDLHISKLNVETGELIIDGLVWSITYSEKSAKKGQGFMSKLFK